MSTVILSAEVKMGGTSDAVTRHGELACTSHISHCIHGTMAQLIMWVLLSAGSDFEFGCFRLLLTAGETCTTENSVYILRIFLLL